MKKVWQGVERVVDGAAAAAGYVAAVCIVVAALIVTEGIVVRKVFGLSATWQIEASVFLLIFATFGGAAFVQQHENHLNVDLVLYYLPVRARETVLVVVSVLACLVTAVVAWYAWPMWWLSFQADDHSMSLWGPPLWIPYFFLPLGMTLLFLQYLVYIGRKWKALKEPSDASGDR